jgi:mannose-6-phosphate isomerase
METTAGNPRSTLREHGLGQGLFQLETQLRERVWGGQSLRASDPPIGEAWLAYGDSLVAAGPLAGRKLADLALEFGPALLGSAVQDRFGGRFPLLAKILDCADWLSVQVHPNDEQAGRMVGPGSFGKTESWFFIEAAPQARILVGVKPDISPAQLAAAIREGRVRDVAQEVAVHDSEAILIPAGTLHALGPGLLLYELQQNSDITYRAYDWGRPQSAGRQLHIEESVAVTTTDPPQPLVTPVVKAETGTARAIECPIFRLDLARVGTTPLSLDTRGLSLHMITAISGGAEVEAGGEVVRLGRFGTVVVAGGVGQYLVRSPEGTAVLLVASVPA